VLIIPEIETVVILVPRTGTTALKNALQAKYPKSMLLYRHMEADGVPHGYDRWRRVGVVRRPVQRLWSLYRYLRTMEQEPNWSPGYADRMRATAQCGFGEWLLTNQTAFTEPYVRGGGVPGYWPKYAVNHALPENRKSQFLYLRPDLGTEVWQFHMLGALARNLGSEDLPVENQAGERGVPIPMLGADVVRHLHDTFAWDFAQFSREPQL
jgi:hypothetical protein